MTTSARDELRLFYALWPEDATRTGLMQLQQAMHGRKSPYGNLHITLAFLGLQPAERLPLLKDILTHLMAAPIQLTLDRVGYFPRKRIAWIGMHEGPQSLLDMRRALVDALVKDNVWFDGESSFKPHVTLARDAELPPDLVFTPITWQATEIVLVQSITHAEGPEYRILASRNLEDASPACDLAE
jgi:2'-5' RNA ligase